MTQAPAINGEMRRDLFVYLSGPITAKHGYSIEDNVSQALRVHLDLLNMGIPNFCPHLSGIFPSAHAAVQYERWIAYDLAVIDRCTHLLMLPRWETSLGAVREFDYAKSIFVPVLLSVDSLRTAMVLA